MLSINFQKNSSVLINNIQIQPIAGAAQHLPQVHIRNIEPYVGKKVAGSKYHEYWVCEKAEVQHLVLNFGFVWSGLETADSILILCITKTEYLLEGGLHCDNFH